jgi:hypothetical protein
VRNGEIIKSFGSLGEDRDGVDLNASLSKKNEMRT